MQSFISQIALIILCAMALVMARGHRPVNDYYETICDLEEDFHGVKNESVQKAARLLYNYLDIDTKPSGFFEHVQMDKGESFVLTKMHQFEFKMTKEKWYRNTYDFYEMGMEYQIRHRRSGKKFRWKLYTKAFNSGPIRRYSVPETRRFTLPAYHLQVYRMSVREIKSD